MVQLQQRPHVNEDLGQTKSKDGSVRHTRGKYIQGKCSIVRKPFFLGDATLPLSIPVNWLSPPTKDIRNPFSLVILTGITTVLSFSHMDSATGDVGVSYHMVTAVQRTNPDLLLLLFSHLLYCRIFPPSSKRAKCVQRLKRALTDGSTPNNLRRIAVLSYLGKAFGKILATCLAQAGGETSTLTSE